MEQGRFLTNSEISLLNEFSYNIRVVVGLCFSRFTKTKTPPITYFDGVSLSANEFEQVGDEVCYVTDLLENVSNIKGKQSLFELFCMLRDNNIKYYKLLGCDLKYDDNDNRVGVSNKVYFWVCGACLLSGGNMVYGVNKITKDCIYCKDKEVHYAAALIALIEELDSIHNYMFLINGSLAEAKNIKYSTGVELSCSQNKSYYIDDGVVVRVRVGKELYSDLTSKFENITSISDPRKNDVFPNKIDVLVNKIKIYSIKKDFALLSAYSFLNKKVKDVLEDLQILEIQNMIAGVTQDRFTDVISEYVTGDYYFKDAFTAGKDIVIGTDIGYITFNVSTDTKNNIALSDKANHLVYNIREQKLLLLDEDEALMTTTLLDSDLGYFSKHPKYNTITPITPHSIIRHSGGGVQINILCLVRSLENEKVHKYIVLPMQFLNWWRYKNGLYTLKTATGVLNVSLGLVKQQRLILDYGIIRGFNNSETKAIKFNTRGF